jgi:hypothetical protein
MNKTRSNLHIFQRFFKSTLFTLYLHMFILRTDQELCTRELICRIMGCDHSLAGRIYLNTFIIL